MSWASKEIFDPLVAASKRAQQALASGQVNAEVQAVLNDLQAATTTVESNLPAIQTQAGASVAAAAVLSAAIASGNVAAIAAAAITVSQVANADLGLVKALIAAYDAAK